MKRVIASIDNINLNQSFTSVDDVPDIDNRYISPELLFAWLDKLVEVKENVESTSDD